MTFGFIILRHVNNNDTNKYWIHCYDCIRNFYPQTDIIIIDDNSNYNFITDKELYKTIIVQSEYHKRGELLPYYYYLHNKYFDKAIIIHDSVFINKELDLNINKYKFLWEFKHWPLEIKIQQEDELKMIKLFNDPLLENFYRNRKLWNGCFGAMSIITHDFLVSVNNKYNIDKLLDYVLCRHNRCSFERVIAGLFQYVHKETPLSLLGHINKYCKWGIKFNKINELKIKKLPLIKVWTGR